MSDIRTTSLTKYAASMRDPDPDGPIRMAARKWHEDGSIILLATTVNDLNEWDRELLRAIAARLYGPRDER